MAPLVGFIVTLILYVLLNSDDGLVTTGNVGWGAFFGALVALGISAAQSDDRIGRRSQGP